MLPAPWPDLLLAHARSHPWTVAGLALALLTVIILLAQSLLLIVAGNAPAGLLYGLIGGTVGFAATALGAMPALILRGLPQKLEDSLLGTAAGMMLAASVFSLLLPGLAAAESLMPGKTGVVLVVAGMALGVMLMLGLDAFTPHEHDKSGPCGPGHARCSRVWLFVFAIAIHNLPESMAVGVGFAGNDLSVGLPLTIAIALQNLPEGLAVALAIRGAGFSPKLAVGVSAGTGLLEPLGALLGITLASGFVVAYPVGLALAAGAMIFVVSHEVIPETHRNGHQTPATIGLMAGFALMMVLDRLLD